MKRNAKIGSLLLAGTLGAVLFIPRSSCACLTPELIFEGIFKVNPLEAGPTATRTAMLTVVPPGTSAAVARAAFNVGSEVDGTAPRCVADSRAIRCDYGLTKSGFGIVRRGVRFAYHLDDHGLVANITTELTTRVLGREL